MNNGKFIGVKLKEIVIEIMKSINYLSDVSYMKIEYSGEKKKWKVISEVAGEKRKAVGICIFLSVKRGFVGGLWDYSRSFKFLFKLLGNWICKNREIFWNPILNSQPIVIVYIRIVK